MTSILTLQNKRWDRWLLICSGLLSVTCLNSALAQEPSPLTSPLAGITGIYPANHSLLNEAVIPELFLDANSNFSYTAGVITITDINSGLVVAQYDPEPGDAQEGQPQIRLDHATSALVPGSTYEITAGHLFTRINAEPWNITTLAQGQWQFSIAEQPEFGPLTNPVAGVDMVYPAPGSTYMPVDITPKIQFSNTTNFSYTGGVIELWDRTTDTLVLSVDPETDDPQEGSDIFEIAIPQGTLTPGHTYEVVAEHLFSRINAEPWNITTINNNNWYFTVGRPNNTAGNEGSNDQNTETGPDTEIIPFDSVAGIASVFPANGSTNVSLAAVPTITFASNNNFDYTDGREIRLVNLNTGSIVASFDPESGDPQESTTNYSLHGLTLEPDTDYEVQADHLFARINTAPWNVSEIEESAWQFTTASQFASDYPQAEEEQATDTNSDDEDTTSGETNSEETGNNDTQQPETSPIDPANEIITTDLTWTENIPSTFPRLIHDEEKLQTLLNWINNSNFNPGSATNTTYGSYDPVGNALKFLATDNDFYRDRAMEGILNGVNAIENSSRHGDQNRQIGDEVIIAYDLLRHEFSLEQQSQILTIFNREFEYYLLQHDWGRASPEFAENNYFWGHFRNAILWGISSWHENPRATILLNRALTERWDEIAIPHFNQKSPSGIPAEGVNYGPYMATYMLNVLDILSAYGRDLNAETQWYRNMAWWLQYAILPKSTHDNMVHDNSFMTWFPYGDASGSHRGDSLYTNGLGNFLGYGLSKWNNTELEKHLRRTMRDTGISASMPEFAAFDDGGDIAPVSDLPLDFFVDGDLAYAYSRSSHSENASVVNLQLATPFAVGHEHQDSGTWQFWKDGVWISRETAARGYNSNDGQVVDYAGEGIRHVNRPVAHNALLVEGEGVRFEETALAETLAVTSEDSYFYGATDITNALQNEKVQSAERHFLFIKDIEVLVIWDKVAVTDESLPVTFLAHFTGEPDVSGNHYQFHNRHVTATVETLLQTDVTVRVIDEGRESLDNSFRMEIEQNGSGPMLHIVSGHTAGETPITANLESTESGYRLDIIRDEHHYRLSFSQTDLNGLVTLSQALDSDQWSTAELTMGIEVMQMDNDGITWTNQYQ